MLLLRIGMGFTLTWMFVLSFPLVSEQHLLTHFSYDWHNVNFLTNATLVFWCINRNIISFLISTLWTLSWPFGLLTRPCNFSSVIFKSSLCSIFHCKRSLNSRDNASITYITFWKALNTWTTLIQFCQKGPFLVLKV